MRKIKVLSRERVYNACVFVSVCVCMCVCLCACLCVCVRLCVFIEMVTSLFPTAKSQSDPKSSLCLPLHLARTKSADPFQTRLSERVGAEHNLSRGIRKEPARVPVGNCLRSRHFPARALAAGKVRENYA